MTLNTLLAGNGKWIKIIQKKVSSSNMDYIWHQVSVSASHSNKEFIPCNHENNVVKQILC